MSSLLLASFVDSRISPFPNTSTLLAGELKCKGITEEEDNSPDSDEPSAAGEDKIEDPSPRMDQEPDPSLTVWFLVGNGGMGYWDYYRGPYKGLS